MDTSDSKEFTIQTFGDDVPKPVQSYEELKLGPLAVHVASYLKPPTQFQKYIMPIIMEGRDLLACVQTGYSKLVAYLIPIFAKLSQADKIQVSSDNTDKVIPQCLILVPTRELAFNILPAAREWANFSDLKARVVVGGMAFDTQVAELRLGCDVLIATPGRLADLVERNIISLSKIKYLCLDELDRIIDMGFEPEIRHLIEQKDMPAQGLRQTLVFSSAMPKGVKRLAQDLLTDFVIVDAKVSPNATPQYKFDVRSVENLDKKSALIDLLRSLEGQIIVFVLYKKHADEVDDLLNTNGLRSTCIHGDRTQAQRNEAVTMFTSGQIPILVATDVASRGLYMPQIAHVINYDMPLSIEDAGHRIGRAVSCTVTFFFNEQDKHLAKGLVGLLENSHQEVPEWLKDYVVPGESRNTVQSRGGRGRGSRGRGYGSSTSTRGTNPYDQHYESQNNDQNEDTGSSNDNK